MNVVMEGLEGRSEGCDRVGPSFARAVLPILAQPTRCACVPCPTRGPRSPAPGPASAPTTTTAPQSDSGPNGRRRRAHREKLASPFLLAAPVTPCHMPHATCHMLFWGSVFYMPSDFGDLNYTNQTRLLCLAHARPLRGPRRGWGGAPLVQTGQELSLRDWGNLAMLELHSSHPGCGVECMHVKGNECLRDCLYGTRPSGANLRTCELPLWSAPRSWRAPFSSPSLNTFVFTRGWHARLRLVPAQGHWFATRQRAPPQYRTLPPSRFSLRVAEMAFTPGNNRS